MPPWFLIVSAALSAIEALMPAATTLVQQLETNHPATGPATAAIGHVAKAAAHLTAAAEKLSTAVN